MKLGFNKNKDIISITMRKIDLEKFCEIINILTDKAITVFINSRSYYQKHITCKVCDLLSVVENIYNDRKSLSLYVLDGKVDECENDGELKLIYENKIRFFAEINFGENEIHIIINNRHYSNIYNILKLYDIK